MRRILLLSLLGIALPVIGSFAPAQAGTGSAESCSTPRWDTQTVNLLTSPITLQLQFTDLSNNYVPHRAVRLCYSTSPMGQSGPDTTGGSIEVVASDYLNVYSSEDYSARCSPQSNHPNTLNVSCYVGTSPSISWATPIEGSNQTYALAVPITFCTNSCTTLTPGVDRTGVIFGEWPSLLSHDSLVPSLTLCLDGSCVPLTPSADAEVNLDQVVLPTTYGPWCICLPSGMVGVKSDRPLTAVRVGSTVIPVTSPVEKCAYPLAPQYEYPCP